MAETTSIHHTETESEFGDQVMGDISSLREELATIRQLLERGHSVNQAIEEFRYLPSHLENPIRWGFLGVWGKGGKNCELSIHTTNEEDFFNHPQASDEKVAAFAATFSHPHTIRVCKYLFRHPPPSREELRASCKLSEEEMETALNPLLEGNFVEWQEGRLQRTNPNFALTLMAMAMTAGEQAAHYQQAGTEPERGFQNVSPGSYSAMEEQQGES